MQRIKKVLALFLTLCMLVGILALAEKTGLTPIVRLRESVDTVNLDNTVYGLTVGTTGQGLLSTPNGVD